MRQAKSDIDGHTIFNWLIILAIFIITILLVLYTIDARVSTPSAIKHCVVSEKHFTPAHTDSDGDNITVHPNRWYLVVSPLFVEVDVTQEQYEQLPKGKAIDVLVRKGDVVGGEYYTVAPTLETK